MNRRFPALALFPALLVALAVAQDQAPSVQPPDPDDVHSFIIFKDQAFVVGKPILVAGPTASHPSWSPTGQFLTYIQNQDEPNVLTVQGSVQDQKPLKPERTLCIYSLAAGKSTEIMRLDPDSENDAVVSWIAGSDKALLHVRMITPDKEGNPEVAEKIFLLDGPTAAAREFSPWEGNDKPSWSEVNPSPTQPYAFVKASFIHRSYTPEGKRKATLSSQVVLVASTGDFGQIRIPDGTSNVDTIWSPDGTKAYLMTRTPAAEGKSQANWYGVSLVNGATTSISRPTEFYMGSGQVGLISVREVSQSSTDGKSTQPINALWLETLDPDSQNRLLLAGDASEGYVNKTVDCASYIAQGSLFIRPISEVPKRRYEEAVVAWNRTQLMQQARQAGLAVLMYSADYDDIFPSSSDNVTAMLTPYIGNVAQLQGFVYTYPGGPATNIASPSTTQIGYVDGGDGRAVVYADGHVKWVPN